jgi:mannose/fructose/N-acetylgalactosamine-specific phosphotransferase system component IIC
MVTATLYLGVVVGDISLVTVLVLAVAAAFLVLDDTSLAQTWLGQPLPASLLAGLICGEPATGLAIGLPFQLLTVGNLPVGQTFTGDRISAVMAGVAAATLSDWQLSVLAEPMSSETAARLGWILIAVAVASSLSHWVVQFERRMHFLWMLEGHRSLRDGNLLRFDLIHLRCLLATALRGAGLVLIWLVLFVFFWIPSLDQLPPRLLEALAYLPLLTPALAVGILLDRYGWRVGWVWLSAGLAGGLLTTWWLA